MPSPGPLPLIVHQKPGLGRFGNKLLQACLARYLSQWFERPTVLCGMDVPQLHHWVPAVPIPPASSPLVLDVRACNSADLRFLPSLVEATGHDAVVLEGWGTTLHNAAHSRDWLLAVVDSLDVTPEPIGPEELCIHLRLADVGRDVPVHPDYSPLPIEFYREVIAASGLSPVFLGQMTEGPYLDSLRSAFPDARFLAPDSLTSFASIQQAHHKVLSVSTFAWLAAWLGANDTTVVMPVGGLFNPLQRPDVSLVPWDDPRYRFRWLAPMRRQPSSTLSEHLARWHDASGDYPEITGVRQPFQAGK